LLLALEERLQVAIYLFSSRAKSLLFEPRDPKYSIGIFFNVDSYHGTGEYVVLVASTRPFILTDTPAPPPHLAPTILPSP
jgi:hypothetical protein